MKERDDLIASYHKGANAILAAMADAPKAAWTWKPAPSEWSVVEILWHCAECEAVFHTRVRTMWIGPERTLVAFDQDDWAASPGYVDLPIDVAIDVIRSTRQMTSLLLSRLPEAAWDATGIHTENGPVSFEGVVRHAAGHLDIHAGQIRDNIRAWRAVTEQDANGER
jgi:hypothetical protein